MSIDPTDEELAQRVREGDRESYGQLAVRHQRSLRQLAQRHARNPADAEDAVQVAHLLALEHFDQYEGRSAYVRWMATITVNAVHGTFRQDRVSAKSVKLQDWHIAATPDPEQIAIRNDRRRMVRRALRTIPPEYRLVLEMRDLAELDTVETSRCLGLTVACVKTRLHRARSLLRRAMAREVGCI